MTVAMCGGIGRVGYFNKPGSLNIGDRLSAALVDGYFDLTPDFDTPGIDLPHVTITAASSSGATDYYKFTVVAGEQLTFDIDGAQKSGSAGFNSALRLYDGNGNALAWNDDAVSGYARDAGSQAGTQDSYLTYRFDQAGTYYIEIGQSTGATGGLATLSSGKTYDLNIVRDMPVLAGDVPQIDRATFQTGGYADGYQSTLIPHTTIAGRGYFNADIYLNQGETLTLDVDRSSGFSSVIVVNGAPRSYYTSADAGSTGT